MSSVFEQVNTTNLNELSNLWSTGAHVYGHGCQLNDTTPEQVFQLAFNHDAQSGKQWFDAILKHQSSVETDYVITAWHTANSTTKSEVESQDSEHEQRIQQRRVVIRANESGLSFFNKKSIIVTLHETAFHEQDCVTIYALCDVKPSEATKIGPHSVIARWTIKRASQPDRDHAHHHENNHPVFVALNVNMIAAAEMDAAAKALTQAKWLGFFQSRFETWRSLLTEHITAQQNVNAAKHQQQQQQRSSPMMEAYRGTWNKLHSLHSIEISLDRIAYSDGSEFKAYVDANTHKIVALYGTSKFIGQLQRGDDYDLIQWSNHSIWIRDGFRRFAGQYVHSATHQKYIVHANGVLQLPVTNRQIRFQLLAPNRLCYPLSRESVQQGGLCRRTGDIEWENGAVWRRVHHNNTSVGPKPPSTSSNSHHAANAANAAQGETQPSPPTEQDTAVEAAAADATAPRTRGEAETAAGPVVDQLQLQANETEHDFEHDFDECVKGNQHSTDSITSAKTRALRLQIQNDSHFVLINRDDIGIDDAHHAINDKVDEWLLV